MTRRPLRVVPGKPIEPENIVYRPWDQPARPDLLPFSPDPLLLTRTERFEAWLWSKRWAHALFGWVLVLFPKRREPDDLADVLKFLAIVSGCAIALALGMLTGAIR